MNSNQKLRAVALKYPKDAQAPVIVAKAKSHLAQKMIEIAEENNIPVVKDELVENILSIEEIGECIPENTWQAVAEIFAMIMDLENNESLRGIK